MDVKKETIQDLDLFAEELEEKIDAGFNCWNSIGTFSCALGSTASTVGTASSFGG